ncbi:MAG TPA: type II toxin-antitoxin system ParD family antitoxin [Blastocatellia bacterium]|nr:type II toxin-antitoxin system ParD family antitoxin [Blastocatellia bacterium]
MTSLNISLPESLREFVEEQVKTGGYGTASEYLRELIRADRKRKAQERLEALLLEGLDSPAQEITDRDWTDLDPAQDPILKFIGEASHGSLAKDIDKELYGE